jgi:hypothetical protein
VEVSSTGQLGIVMSSVRYKRDIRNMGDASARLMKLRPVTFRYKSDPAGALQYGLVAEEVAELYPELVTHGPDGKVMTMRYSMLSAMLLNELQKQARENERQVGQIQRLTWRCDQQAEQNRHLSVQVAATRLGLAAERTAFERRLSALEQTMAMRNRDRVPKLTAAFDKY